MLLQVRTCNMELRYLQKLMRRLFYVMPIYATREIWELHSILQKIVNRSELFVNSYHRQGTVKVAPGFVVSAVSDDGNIEAIESVRTPTMIGVQFHPEMMQSAEFFQIFCNLVQDATK